MNTINLHDIGPVHSLSIPIQPGVVVLRGANDCGKSLTLDAVSRLAGGNGSVSCRDNAIKGEVEGLGVRIAVRQSARRSGELEALSIEGKLSIADLVNPGLKDPVAADRLRIKALLQLTGAKADISLFTSLVPPGIEPSNVFQHATTTADDLVEMAARAKRDLEALSRSEEDAATKADTLAASCRLATAGIDLSIETDATVLQAELEDAIFAQGEIAARAQSAKETAERADSARKRLVNEASPPDVAKARAALDSAAAEMTRAATAVSSLENALRDARAEAENANAAMSSAEDRMRLEVAHDESIRGWRETIEAAEKVERPTAEQSEQSERAVILARQAVDAAAVVRAAKIRASDTQKHFKEANRRRRSAESFREAAKGTDDVLSAAVASDSLTVRGGRLITKHPERIECFYAERSDGTRWKLAIDEAIKRIRQLGAEKTAIIPIPQAAWGELQPSNRRLVHEYAKQLGVTLITAEATDDTTIHAEVFAP